MAACNLTFPSLQFLRCRVPNVLPLASGLLLRGSRQLSHFSDGHRQSRNTIGCTKPTVFSKYGRQQYEPNLLVSGRFTRRHHNLVGNTAPPFSATAVLKDGSFTKLSLDDFKNSYVLLFFYPLDFTFVCPSEIIAFDKALNEFKDRGVEVIGCSVDSHFSHLAWRKTPREKGGIGEIMFPLVADLKKQIAEDYGVLNKDGLALRGLFILNRDHKICHALINDLAIGRSVDEALRIIDAIQFIESHGEVCPANWKKGQKAMKPTAEGVASYLSSQE